MNNVLTHEARAVLAAVRPDGPTPVLGRALRLYLALILAANREGLVIRARKRLADELTVSEHDVDSWFARLSEAKLVRLLSPAPFLAIKLPFWSGDAPSLVEKPQQSASDSASSDGEVPVSSNSNSSSNAKAIALSSNAGVRGQGEGVALRNEICAALPEADGDEIERILARYPRAVLRRTLDRVAKTPPAKIRKSKAALFRFLLAKFSQEIDVNDL